jgi:acetoin utilization protein AcuB
MKPNPIVVNSDTLLSEAKRIITANNLHALPVVDDNKLRGMITRVSCLRAAQQVALTQNADEFEFFANRLKVKDIMVRNPATMDANDTMEHCLERGRDLGVAQFPVMDDGEVVGVISANEIFNLAAHFLGAWEKRSGVTLAPMEMKPGTIGKIADAVESTGAVLQAIYPISTNTVLRETKSNERKVIVRFHFDDIDRVVKALADAGYETIESVQADHSTH